MADLVMQEAYHAHAADNASLTQDHVLVVQEALNRLYSESAGAIISLNTLWPDGSTIPVPYLEAQTGTRIVGDEEGRLPGISLSARTGLHLAEKLPDLEATGTLTSPILMSLDAKLPDIEVEGRTGAGGNGVGILPAMQVSAAIDRIGCTLAKSLPGFKIASEGSTPVIATLSKDLPALRLAVTVTGSGVGTLDRKIPAFKISAHLVAVAQGSLNKILPELQLTSASGYSGFMELDVALPAFMIADLATGQITGGSAEMQNTARFTDYILRHVR